MTRHLIVIGNSHVAAIRAGWQRIADRHPGLSIRFFAASSTLYNQLELRDGRFGMHEPERYEDRHRKFLQKLFGRHTVDLTRTDAVLIVGRTLYERDHLRQLARFSIDGQREIPGGPRLSAAAYDAFADAIVERALPGPEWRMPDGPRLYMLPAPVPGEHCPEGDPRYRDWAAFAAEPQDNVAFVAAYRARARARLAECGITLLLPPERIYAPDGLTLTRYLVGAGKLVGGRHVYDKGDFHHMNATYGALVLSDALRRIAADLPPPPAPEIVPEKVAALRGPAPVLGLLRRIAADLPPPPAPEIVPEKVAALRGPAPVLGLLRRARRLGRRLLGTVGGTRRPRIAPPDRAG